VRWRRIDHFLNIQLELFKPLFKRYRKSCIEALSKMFQFVEAKNPSGDKSQPQP